MGLRLVHVFLIFALLVGREGNNMNNGKPGQTWFANHIFLTNHSAQARSSAREVEWQRRSDLVCQRCSNSFLAHASRHPKEHQPEKGEVADDLVCAVAEEN